LKIKITLDSKAIDVDEMENINDIVTEAKDILEDFEGELQSLQDDFSMYGTIEIVVDEAAEAESSDLVDNIRKRVAGRFPAVAVNAVVTDPSFDRDHSVNPDGIMHFIYTEKGTRLLPTELVQGPNKGKIALMWPCGSFLHNDQHISSHMLWKHYDQAGVSVDKRAV
jgi:hypothetical protein